MKDVLRYALRLLLQLLIFAVTGRWPTFAPRSPPHPHSPPRPRAGRPRLSRGARAPNHAARAVAAPMRSWSHRDEGARFEPDLPLPREGGGARVRSAPPPSRPARPPTRSLGSALRDRRVLRDALTLDAALGTRGPRR